MDKVNQHIINYIDNYLNLPEPEFAILLSGKWGSGKTFFIDNYIENISINKYKFVKISLFGMNQTSSIDEQIFQNLHPYLSSKSAKIAGNIFKGALKLGVNFDYNNDQQSDGKINYDFKGFNPLEYFSEDKKKKDLVFVFDDIERTNINLKLVLGYINQLLEGSNYKMILLADEDKLKANNNSESSNEYINFKEKVIGKTFQINHNTELILKKFIDEHSNNAKVYLNKCFEDIQNIYFKANYNNLRHLKQTIIDFEYFIKDIHDKYLKSDEFTSKIIRYFFIFSIELKGGKLLEEDLNKTYFYSSLDNAKESEIKKLFKNYNIDSIPLFTGVIWVKILLKSSISIDELEDNIKKLTYFYKEENKPTWIRLWNYTSLTNDEFQNLSNEMEQNLKNNHYKTEAEFLHVIALLIYFSKEDLISLSIEDIKIQVEKSIEFFKGNNIWNNVLFKKEINFNSTGLGYFNNQDEDFRSLFKRIREENENHYYEYERLKQQDELKSIFDAMNSNDEEYLKQYFNTHKDKPILKDLDVKEFLNNLYKVENKTIDFISRLFMGRYDDHHSINQQLYYCFYLSKELDFWEKVKQRIDEKDLKPNSLKSHLIKEFYKYCVLQNIEKLSQCKMNKDNNSTI